MPLPLEKEREVQNVEVVQSSFDSAGVSKASTDAITPKLASADEDAIESELEHDHDFTIRHWQEAFRKTPYSNFDMINYLLEKTGTSLNPVLPIFLLEDDLTADSHHFGHDSAFSILPGWCS